MLLHVCLCAAEQEQVVKSLIELLMGWENVYQLLRYRRNVCAAQPIKMHIARSQLEQRLEQEQQAFAAEDITIYQL